MSTRVVTIKSSGSISATYDDISMISDVASGVFDDNLSSKINDYISQMAELGINEVHCEEDGVRLFTHTVYGDDVVHQDGIIIDFFNDVIATAVNNNIQDDDAGPV